MVVQTMSVTLSHTGWPSFKTWARNFSGSAFGGEHVDIHAQQLLQIKPDRTNAEQGRLRRRLVSPVDRFDTAAKIKGKVTDLPCFKQQDALLDEWIALRRVGMALRDAPLYPLAPLPARRLLPNFAEHVSSVLATASPL